MFILTERIARLHSIYGNPKYPLVKDKHMNDKLIGPGFLGFNAGHVTVDSTDPASLTEAMMKGRKLARQLHEGLVEFETKVIWCFFFGKHG